MTKLITDIDFLWPGIRKIIGSMIDDFGSETAFSLRILETYRSPERQNSLWALGRTIPDTKKVTFKRAYQSMHQYGLACDFVVDTNPDKPGIQDPYSDQIDWPLLGNIGTKYGLEWGGAWLAKDMGHFQVKTSYTISDLQSIYLEGGLLYVWQKISEEKGLA